MFLFVFGPDKKGWNAITAGNSSGQSRVRVKEKGRI
jgi:hypothetical protein